MDNQPKQPELVHRDGSLKATVWKNDGDKGAYYTTTFARTYTDAQGNPRDTQSFSQTDLLRLAELGRETYGIINDLKREQAQTQRVSQDQSQQPDQQQQQTQSRDRDEFKQSRRPSNGQDSQNIQTHSHNR